MSWDWEQFFGYFCGVLSAGLLISAFALLPWVALFTTIVLLWVLVLKLVLFYYWTSFFFDGPQQVFELQIERRLGFEANPPAELENANPENVINNLLSIIDNEALAAHPNLGNNQNNVVQDFRIYRNYYPSVYSAIGRCFVLINQQLMHIKDIDKLQKYKTKINNLHLKIEYFIKQEIYLEVPTFWFMGGAYCDDLKNTKKELFDSYLECAENLEQHIKEVQLVGSPKSLKEMAIATVVEKFSATQLLAVIDENAEKASRITEANEIIIFLVYKKLLIPFF